MAYSHVPTYIGAGAFTSGTAALTVAIPTGYRNDDLLMLVTESANQAITAPAGWVEIGAQAAQATGTAAAAGGVRLAVFWKLATGAEPSVTVADSGDHTTGQIFAFRGVDPANPFGSVIPASKIDSVATTAMAWTALTTTTANNLIVMAAALDADVASTAAVGAITAAGLTSVTERSDNTVIAGFGGGITLSTGIKATAGATGTITATGSTSTTHAYLTMALQGRSDAYTVPRGQYKSDLTTVVPLGSNEPISNNGMYLLADISPVWQTDNAITPKVEVVTTASSLAGTATVTQSAIKPETSDVTYSARGGTLVHDEKNDRYLFFGGYDGTTRYANVWSKDMRTPGRPWRKLAPTGTPPTAKNLAAATYVRGTKTTGGADTALMVVWGGNIGASDTNEMHVLDVTTPGSEVWSLVTQTSAPTARSYVNRHMVATPVTGDASQNFVYLFGGWAAARENQLVRCTIDVDTPTTVTWTTLKATGTAGNPSIRSGAIMDYKASTGKIYIYGGYNGTTYLNDFWSYDIAGNTFTQISPTGTAPTGTELGAGGFDATNNRFWYTGGWSAGTQATNTNHIGYISGVGLGTEVYNSVRAQDGDNQHYASHSSSANWFDKTRGWLVMNGMMTFDSTERYSFVIDTTDGITTNKPVYGLNDAEWMQPRDAPGSLYDPDGNEWLTISGFSGMGDEVTIASGTHINDIWAYNQTTNSWRYANKGHLGMPHTEGITVVYDTTRDRVIMFGGLSGISETGNEVWAATRDGNGLYDVKRLNPTGTPPVSRWLCAGVFDPANNRALFVMGGDKAGQFTDVWELSFSGGADGVWTQRSPTGTPPTAVVGSGFADKASNTRLYIHGGATVPALTTVTAQLTYLDYSTTNTAWGAPTSSAGTARRTPGLGYDSINDKLITFGGYGGSNSIQATQYWDVAAGGAWVAANPTVLPDARRSLGYWFNTYNGTFLITHGRSDASPWYSGTWELRPDYVTPSSSTWTARYPRRTQPHYFLFDPNTTGLYHWQAWETEEAVDQTKVPFPKAVETYYLDASDAAATDPNSAWNNDANAFDNSVTTVATSVLGSGSASTNYLMAEGTNAPASDTRPISQVRARVYGSQTSNNAPTVTIYSNGLAASLGVFSKDDGLGSGSRTSWSVWTTLSAPSGGWDWTKLSQLETKIWMGGTIDVGGQVVGRIEFEVTVGNSDTVTAATDFQLGGSSTFTKTHTTDAVKRKQSTVFHTTDTNKKKTTTKTHTTDANRKFGLSHTTDGLKTIGTSSTAFTYMTAASSDDANEVVATGVVNITDQGNGGTIAKLDGTNHGGFRFPNVTIAKNTTILSAKIFFEQLNNYQGFGNMNTTTWYMEDVDNSAAFTTAASNISGRTRNTTYPLTGADAGTFWTTNGHDFTSPVQATLNRAGWASGNAMAVLAIGNGTAGGFILPYMWDYFSGNYHAKLVITVSTPAHREMRRQFTTDAYKSIGVPSFTKTHTTDAFKRKQLTLTHTTDALKRKQDTRTHTTDANKKKTTTVFHTTDANKKKTLTVLHTTDANKKKSGLTRTHTTDANKRTTGITRTHTTDALKRKQNTLTHTTDSFKRTQNTRTHTTDALKRGQYVRTHTTDANKKKTTTVFHTTSSNIKKSGLTRSHTTDALKRKAFTVAHSTDSLKRKTNTLSHTTDALKKVAGITRSHTTDAYLKKVFTKTHTTDANKKRTTLVSHTTDANKKVTGFTRTHTTDALKKTAGILKTHTTDAFKRTQNTRSHTTDSLKRKQFTLAHSTDANKKKTSTKTHTTDANRRVSGNLHTHTTDALKRKQNTVSHSTDANKKKTANTRTHTTDAYKRKTFTLSHTTDANKSLTATVGPRSPATATFSADGFDGWTNPNNIFASDDAYATATMGVNASFTNYLIATNFGFTIPAGATINGITMEFERKGGGTAVDRSIKLVKAGSYVGTDKSAGASWGASDSYATYGSTSDLWGTTWTVADINASNFGVAIQAGSSGGFVNASVDHVRISVTYTPGFPKVQHTTDANKRKVNTLTHTTDTNKKTSGLTRSHTTDTFKVVSVASGPRSPGTGADSAAVGTITWNNTGNILTSDNTYADASAAVSGGTSHYLKGTNFGFAVPSTATIRGILVEIEKRASGNGVNFVQDSRVSIIKSDGSVGTTNKGDTVSKWATTDTYISYGSSTDLWGETWTYSDINDVDFGVALSALLTVDTSVSAFVDHMRITVYYTTPTPSFTASHSTDALKRKTSTVSHTTDSNKKKTGTLSHTTDANKKKTGTVSHTTDALKRKQSTVAHTTDALKRKQNTRTHTTDAFLRRQITKTHTTDSFLRRQITKTHTTDANKRKALTVLHTTDANKKKAANTRTHTTDALKRRQLTLTHTTDALKRTQTVKTHTTDAFKRTQNTRTHTTDSNKRRVTTVSHTTDANKKLAAITRSHTTDSLLRRQLTRTHTTDALKRRQLVLTHTTDAFKRTQNVRTHTTDANKKRATTVLHTTDANKKRATLVSHTTDSLKRKTNTVSHTTDANKKKATTRTHTTDAFLRKTNTRSHTTDANRKKALVVSHATDANKRKATVVFHTTDTNKKVTGFTRSHTTDTLKRRQLVLAHSTDTFKRRAVTVTHTTDAFKRTPNVVVHTTDANKKRATTVTHTTDSNKKKAANTRTHTTDALKRTQNIKTHSTDANKRLATVKSHTTDALKRKTFTVSHTTDSNKKKATTRTHTTDANKRVTAIVRTHTTDAFKRTQNVKTHTTDAFKRTQNTLTHTTDALKRRAVTVSHTTDSNKRKALTVSHSTDANKKKALSVSHTTDANKRKTGLTRSHTTDTLLRRQLVRTHTTDALKRTQTAKTHTTDALLRKQNIRTHTTDSNKRRATVVSHSTDANKRRTGLIVSHTTDANKRTAGLTRSHTTSAFLRKQNTRSHTTDANKKRSYTVTHTTSGYLRGANERNHTTDANKRRANTVQHTTSANRRKLFTVSHTTDALKHTSVTRSHTTDTILHDTRFYTREQNVTLPTSPAPRAIGFTQQQVVDVGVDDNANYVDQFGAKYLLFYFERYAPTNRNEIYITWNGKSTIDTMTRPVSLELYNVTTGLWEVLDMNNVTPNGTEFTLIGTKLTGLSDYYDASNKIVVRVYQ